MKFGVLFTSHPHVDKEPYPHREVHARVTAEILEADRLGYDIAWIAEHHFSNSYGILPDPFTYIGYLAGQTQHIRLGTAVMTLPLYNPVRVVENAAFADILSKGRFILGLGSGYRPYEFEGMGVSFDERRDIQEEALEIVLDALQTAASSTMATISISTCREITRFSPPAYRNPTCLFISLPVPTVRSAQRHDTAAA
ncbi:MAG: hypothetical protein CM1200mP20_07690 [Pseudomonadota bacterium]|nr:MAG: hypothetical protein CM1200mP20_07690 [Pseudomonadota bacterium]